MKPCLCLVVMAALLVPAGPAAAQSLGEAAAKERARRKTRSTPAKVYTDDDVAHAAPSEPAPADTGASPAPAASETSSGDGVKPAEKSAEDARAEEQASWRAELDKTNAEIGRLEGEIARLDVETSDTRGYLYGNRRTQALEELARARTDLAAARQKVDDLLTRSRQRGFRAP